MNDGRDEGDEAMDGPGGIERKVGHKRKLAESMGATSADSVGEAAPAVEVRRLRCSLRQTLDAEPLDRLALRRAAHALAELAKVDENVDLVVQEGGVDVIVPLLTLPKQDLDGAEVSNEEVEKEACFTIGLLAVKPEHQQRIADSGALPGLVALLKRGPSPQPPTAGAGGGGVARRAADAITNLAHENPHIKLRVRTEGGIPPLVALLDSHDMKVQRAAAGALRTLAFKNEENKNQIVECGALPTLILMLRSEDKDIHYEAVGVIGNLVHSSQHIKKRVLEEGALQPVIGLLSSRCTESQREAALLLGQFATTDPDFKIRIVQRGAVRPLIVMLSAEDTQLREMAAFALGRLAQNADNQAGIAHAGGLRPLLSLLDSRNGSLQHNAAFALYGLADNADNIASIVREGGVNRLMDGELIVQASKDCVHKTIKRLEEKVQDDRVLQQLLYLLRSADKQVQQRTGTALAHLAGDEHLRQIFLDPPHCGIDVLLDMLAASATAGHRESGDRERVTERERVERERVEREKVSRLQRDAAKALHTVMTKAKALADVACAPPPTPQVYLGAQYVNNQTLSDVTFVVEGRKFYAHRIALLASSDAFRAMFDGGYKEREASDIDIPNISWRVFESMMKCVYTGFVEVTSDIAQELLRAADQYLLEGLKRLCEASIAKDLTADNVADAHQLAEAYHAPQLAKRCAMYALEHYVKVSEWCEEQRGRDATTLQKVVSAMLPTVRLTLTEALTRVREPVVSAAPVAAATAVAPGGPPAAAGNAVP